MTGPGQASGPSAADNGRRHTVPLKSGTWRPTIEWRSGASINDRGLTFESPVNSFARNVRHESRRPGWLARAVEMIQEKVPTTIDTSQHCGRSRVYPVISPNHSGASIEAAAGFADKGQLTRFVQTGTRYLTVAIPRERTRDRSAVASIGTNGCILSSSLFAAYLHQNPKYRQRSSFPRPVDGRYLPQ